MRINKYKKKSNGKYTVELEDGREFTLYEDVILKFNLLIKKTIDDSEIESINNLNKEYDVYYVALKSVKSRVKSTHDLRMLLLKNEYPIDLIDNAIEKLTSQGYLDDRSFAFSYVNNQMLSTSYGPYKIERDLLEKKIDNNIIRDALLVFDDDEQSVKIKKIINKKLKSNNNRGGIVLKQKIFNDLKLLGYDIVLSGKILDNYLFDNDNNLAKKEYDKLIKKYSRKYSGEELKMKVREKLYQKGLKYEEN